MSSANITRSTFSASLYRGHPPFSSPVLLPRGGFTVKLMSLKLQGSSLARAPSKALGGAQKILTFIPNFIFFFVKRTPKIAYKLQSPQHLDPPLLLHLIPINLANPVLSFKIY
jgi:hypothetical protein